MRALFIIIMSMTYYIGHAHSAKEAYFNIYKSEQSIDVYAEFPWTIRNALLTFKPELDQIKDDGIFEDAFFTYVEQNFKVLDENSTPLKLLEIKKNKVNGHAHQTNYIFRFKKGQLKQISNTLMFNINKEQVNHHILYPKTDVSEYISSFIKPSFLVQEKSQDYTATIGIVAILIILTVGLLLKPFIKK